MGCGPSIAVSNGSPSVAAPSGWDVAYEVDFGEQGTAALINGQNVTADGRSWTGVNVATATTFEWSTGVGINLAAGTSNTAWSSAPAFTAAAIWISLNDPTLPVAQRLIPDYDINRQYVFQLHNTANNGNAATEVVSFNLWAPANTPYAGAVDRIAGVCKGGNATVASGCGFMTNTGTVQLIGAYGANDVIGFTPCVGAPAAMAGHCGAYGSDWPSMSDLVECGYTASTGTPAATTTPLRFNDRSMRLAIAFPTGNTTGTFAAQVRRMRVLVRG